MKIRVYYEDTDTEGIVYHANYIKFCDRARTEYLLSLGIMPGVGDEYGFVVRHLEADYLAPARLGDMLEVKNKLLEIKHSSFTLEQKIYKGEVEIFSLSIVLVYIKGMKITRIPDDLREVFINIR
ncbi:MAG: acyl-CoA thioesterase [Sulfurovum sp.]|nr:MAG: acyl-CoA thioesterase [Sulfurovum sp.]